MSSVCVCHTLARDLEECCRRLPAQTVVSGISHRRQNVGGGRTRGAPFGAKSMPGRFGRQPLRAQGQSAHHLPRRNARALPLVRIGLATSWLMLLASWWFWSTVPREALERPTWPSHAWLTGLRALVLRLDNDATWTPGRGRAIAGRSLTAPQGAFARSVSTQSVRHAVDAVAQQAPEHAAQRNKSGLTALLGHRIVDLLQGGMNLVARLSTNLFLTLCDVHLKQNALHRQHACSAGSILAAQA